MEELPPLIRWVRRDRPLRVSSLGLHRECLLRLCLTSSSEHRPSLPPGLWAELGRVLHDFVETHPFPSEEDWRNLTKEILGGALTAESTALSDVLPLTELLPTGVVLRRIASMKRPVGRPGPESASTNVTRRNAPTVEVERRVNSATYDLVGRIDRLEVWPDGRRVITDFKTGPIKSDGVVRTSYRTQVNAYGLLIREEHPDVAIDLVLSGSDDNWTSRFDESLKEETEAVLRGISSDLPREAILEAESLATFGPACRGCRHRPSCPAYLRAAPATWHQPDATYPVDRWGNVERVDAQGHLTNVLLRGPQSRLHLITGVPKGLLPASLTKGDELWFFDVVRTSASAADSRCHHVLDPAQRELSAHRVAVFMGRPHGDES